MNPAALPRRRAAPRKGAEPGPVPAWAARLRDRRLELHWTQRRVAVKLGVTPQFLSLLEHGLRPHSFTPKRGPRGRPILRKLAKLLGLDFAELMQDV